MRDQGSGWRGSDADEMDDVGRGCRSKEMLTTRSSGAGSDFQRRSPAGAVRSPAWRGWARPLGNLVTGQTPRAWSRRERQCAQSGQGTTELVLPGPALGEMQGETARLAGDASGQGEEASSEGLGGRHWLAQADARGPAGQVVGHHWTASQAALAGKRPEGRWLRPTPYFRSRMAFSISAWLLLTWPRSASSSRVSPSLSVMKP